MKHAFDKAKTSFVVLTMVKSFPNARLISCFAVMAVADGRPSKIKI